MARRGLLGGTCLLAICVSASSSAAPTTVDIADAAASSRSVPVTLSFPIARGGDLGFDLVLNYHAIDGTAVAGTDYTAPSGPLIAPAGAATSSIPVQLLANSGGPAPQTFQLQLDSAFGVGNAPAFAAQQTFGTGAGPAVVLAADINGDGKADLVVENQVDQTVSVLLNTTAPGAGTPTFSAQQTYPAGFNIGIAVADLNGDGKTDVIIVNVTSGGISVLMNTTPTGATSASFSTQPVIPVDSSMAGIAAADLNGDGRVDLVVSSGSNNRIAVLRNTTALGGATASFAAPLFLDTGTFTGHVGAFDLNGDGKPDVVAVNNSSSSIAVFLNTTDVSGTTLSFTTKTAFATGSLPVAVTAADLNGDGLPDLVVANQGDATVSILGNTTARGATTPSFTAAQPFLAGAAPTDVAAIDINADGKPDIVVTNFGSGTLSVLRNLSAPGGPFRFAEQLMFALQTSPSAVAVADFNGDGKTDLAAVNRNSGTASVLLNATPAIAATSDFGPLRTLIGVTSENSLAVADFNGDGKPDFVAPDANSASFVSYINITAPGATTATAHVQQFQAFGSPSGIGAADFNGDGKPDVVVSNLSTQNISVSLNTTVTGSSNASYAMPLFVTTDIHPMGVCIADFNGDGKPDVATGTFDGSVVSVLLNTTATGATSASFAPLQSFATGSHDAAIACGDLNGDGKADILVANASDNTVSILRNTTALGATVPSFATQQIFATGSGPSGLAIADINGDGLADILVANVNAGTASVLLSTTAPGATTLSFGTHVDFAAGAGATWVTASDVDGDGKLDLLVANKFAHSVSVLLNTAVVGASTPSFSTASALQTDDDPMAVALFDFNGDGQLDVVTANESASASVLLNRRLNAVINAGTATGTIINDVIFANGFE